MAMEITFELSDDDLEYFKKVMVAARQKSGNLDPDAIIGNARQLLTEISQAGNSDFIRERMGRLEPLIGMVVDKGWALEDGDRTRVLDALAYLSDSEDLIPDEIPGLGYLDDAIMIEMVSQELQHEIEAYREFCVFRTAESARLGQDAEEFERSDWLEKRRKQLHARMRSRRSRGRGSSGGKSPFSLF